MSSSPLDSLLALNVLDVVRVPHGASIVKERSDKGPVGLLLYRLGATPHGPPEQFQSPASLVGEGVDAGLPTGVSGQHNT